MIKKTIVITTAFSLLFLTGCSQTAPGFNGSNAGKNNISDATQIAGDTVTIDENQYGNETAGSAAAGKYNSSGNGFQSIYFAFGDYAISSNMENNIASDANVVNRANAAKIKIEGNCDEFGTDEYNYALGLKRAKAVKDAIAAQGGNTGNIVIVSFGESNPVCSDPTDECYARNRRVDLRLVK
ncbi:MAG: lipoprotein [Epsilonproteobacteria bacterium (ex Lamellibrachia satsuma)]|nr:MAG: lipoprotein [Epsilonproteobacteria bacterium (ex Lamellibrachia satsuma)]